MIRYSGVNYHEIHSAKEYTGTRYSNWSERLGSRRSRSVGHAGDGTEVLGPRRGSGSSPLNSRGATMDEVNSWSSWSGF